MRPTVPTSVVAVQVFDVAPVLAVQPPRHAGQQCRHLGFQRRQVAGVHDVAGVRSRSNRQMRG